MTIKIGDRVTLHGTVVSEVTLKDHWALKIDGDERLRDTPRIIPESALIFREGSKVASNDESRLNNGIEGFSKRWRPKDAYEFDAELNYIVRMAMAEAVKPFSYELNVHREARIQASLLDVSKLLNRGE